jgi:DNA-binding NarL/FixJ family response regulator
MEQIKVLIVDDHKESRKIVRDFLGRFSQINIVGEATDGVEALQQTDLLLPDIVLMDIAMPKRNGLEATCILKQRHPSTKVILVTVYDNPVYRMQAEEVRADGFIVKSSFKSGLEKVFGLVSLPPQQQLPLNKSSILFPV